MISIVVYCTRIEAVSIPVKSFFVTLKKELLYRITTYKMKRNDVKSIIFKYVFIYYN